MKKSLRTILAALLALCFMFAFASSAGAVEAANAWVSSFDNGDFGDIVEYDYINKTERIISQNEIFDYASVTNTTYELDGMESELDRLAEMNASMSVGVDGGASTLGFVNPDEPYTLSPPVNNGVYQSPSSGTMLLLLGIDTDNDGGTDYYGRATGFMVSPKVMATAGHCVKGYPSSTEEIVEVRVYPFYHGSPRPDKLNDAYFIYPSTWIYSTQYSPGNAYDWCIVTLQQSIPNAYMYPCTYTRNIEKSYVSVTAYPVLNNNEDDCYQRRSAGSIVSVQDRVVGHTCNTDVGSSGAPISVRDIAYPNICVAIHIGDLYVINLGVRITEDLFNYICDRIEKS